MSKKLKTKISKSFIAICLPLAIMAPVLISVFSPSIAFAEIKNLSAQRDRTILYALIRCMKDASPSDFGSTASGEGIRQTNLDKVVLPGHLDSEMAVGYEIDESDGNADCSQISLNRAMRPIDKTPKWFFEQIYDLDHPENRNGTLLYPRRGDNEINNLAGKLNQAMGGRDLSIGNDERLRRLATAFWVCAEEAPDPPDRETSAFNGKKYQLRGDTPGEISVGYDMEADNGKYECNTLLHWGNKNEMSRALQTYPQGSTPGSSGGQAKGSENDKDLADCSASGFSPLSWIICPIIDMASGTSDYIFGKIIQPILENVDITTETNNGAYQAWQGFRILGNIILIGAMLALVYGTTRGGQ